MAKIHPTLRKALKVYHTGTPKSLWFPAEQKKWKEDQLQRIRAIVEKHSADFLFRDWYLSSFVFQCDADNEDDAEKLINSYLKCIELAEKFHEVMLVIVCGLSYTNDHHGIRSHRLRTTLYANVVVPLLDRYLNGDVMPRGDRKEFIAFWELLSTSPKLVVNSSAIGRWMEDLPEQCGIPLYPPLSC